MKVLVTGTSGFIGHAVAHRLLDRGDSVFGLDNHNDYYAPSFKQARRQTLLSRPGYRDCIGDLQEKALVDHIFADFNPQRVIHLAAQAGVRYSLEHPHCYIDANITGFLNILEACRHSTVEHLVYASSSSVYGANRTMPYIVTQSVDRPVSLYAATKKANELMAHSYAHLFDIAVTGLRFFTVYGPWGRPDMAPFKFLDAILRGKTLELYNYGDHSRDFTFIDDIVSGVVGVMDDLPSGDGRYQVHNIGRGEPVNIGYFVELLEQAVGKRANKVGVIMQAGDVVDTWADVSDLEQRTGYRPQVNIEEGVDRFVRWYQNDYCA